MRPLHQIGFIFALLAGCYSPQFVDCSVECGGSPINGALCPKNTVCLSDGFCHATREEPLCGAGDGDGDGDGDGGLNACDPCELVSQCGCESDEACDNDLDPTCRPAGNARQGEVCSAANDCAAGFTCLGPPGGRACHEFCEDDTTCDGGGGLCNVDIAGGPQLVCTTDCNPVNSSGCPASFGCSANFNNELGRYHTNCHAGGPGGQDASCSTLSDCLPGFHCASFASPICLRSCVVGDSSVCTGGRTCRSFNPNAVIDGVEYGGCLL